MNKNILLVTIILAAILGSFEIIKINEKDNSVSQHYDMDISDDILCDGDRAESGYTGDDLVYREYSWGHYLEKGYKIIIEKENIICEAENIQTIVIVLNGNIYNEIPFDNNDIEFTLEKSGNYAFLAIDSDGNSVDITPMVKVNISADGGVILLN